MECAILALAVVILVTLVLRGRTSAGLAAAARETRADLRHLGERIESLSQTSEAKLHALERSVRASNAALREDTLERAIAHERAFQCALHDQKSALARQLAESQLDAAGALRAGLESAHRQLGGALERSSAELGRRLDEFTRSANDRLEHLSGRVEQRLSEGLDNTRKTFADVLARLALIDEAQKRITELSSSVLSLQEVLSDKSARGAFGEVQLAALVRNVLPHTGYSLQHTLSNGRVADCVLFLPPPTGTVAVDAKFPLESFRRLRDESMPGTQRREAGRQFKRDVRRHVEDVHQRYIVPGETAEGAVMFIPAEAVFAEIQAHHEDVVEAAHRLRVWIVSPTTMMAILNTARAVLKDEATRRQVDVIREHLCALAADFERFRKRMNKLSRHIKLAQKDVDEVNVSARAISSRFERIEAGEVERSVAAEDDAEEGVGRPEGDDEVRALEQTG